MIRRGQRMRQQVNGDGSGYRMKGKRGATFMILESISRPARVPLRRAQECMAVLLERFDKDLSARAGIAVG